MENGKQVEINAPANSADNIYIQHMKVNGGDYTKNYLTHKDLMEGSVIDIEMGNKPNKSRGVAAEDAPYSFSKE